MADNNNKVTDSQVVSGAMSTVKSAGFGLNLGLGRTPSGGLGVGSTLTMAGVGAAAGIGMSAISGGSVDPAVAAVAGAGIGAAALPAAGFAVGAGAKLGYMGARAIPGAMAGIGSAVIGATPYAAAVGATAAAKTGTGLFNLSKRFVQYNEAAAGLEKVKFLGPISGAKAGWARGFNAGHKTAVGKAAAGTWGGVTGAILNGKTVLFGGALVSGAQQAWGALERAKMGQHTGIMNMTPRTPSYADNSGATGDLVFALNSLRNG